MTSPGLVSFRDRCFAAYPLRETLFPLWEIIFPLGETLLRGTIFHPASIFLLRDHFSTYGSFCAERSFSQFQRSLFHKERPLARLERPFPLGGTIALHGEIIFSTSRDRFSFRRPLFQCEIKLLLRYHFFSEGQFFPLRDQYSMGRDHVPTKRDFF